MEIKIAKIIQYVILERSHWKLVTNSLKVSPDFKVVSKRFIKNQQGVSLYISFAFQMGIAVRWPLDIVIKSLNNNICNKGKFVWQKNFYTT